MLFRRQDLDRIAAGTMTVTFRRWDRARAVAGSRQRTAVGVISIEAVDRVTKSAITPDDAHRAGYPSRAELLRDLARRGDSQIFKIELRLAGPDPRVALREHADLSPDQVAGLSARLARMDARSPHGPWTLATLRLISELPAVRAGDLAARLGRERLPFKVDVRKLKELGLTESLEIGYRLSPRGWALLAELEPSIEEG